MFFFFPRLTAADSRQCDLVMPVPIERSVIRQNVEFMHNRNQFSQEYFNFMKRLSFSNTPGQTQYSLDLLPVSAG